VDAERRLEGKLGAIGQWYSTGGTRRHLRGHVDYTILHYVPTTLGVQS
jgi:hypothetical protein